MVSAERPASQLEPELAMHTREVARNHSWQYVAQHLKDRREEMIRYMAHPQVITNHPVLSGLVGQIDELNYIFDVLGLDKTED